MLTVVFHAVAAAAAVTRGTAEEAAHLDGQGRCVITDHGLFVLLNVYLPACSNVIEQNRRAQFKVCEVHGNVYVGMAQQRHLRKRRNVAAGMCRRASAAQYSRCTTAAARAADAQRELSGCQRGQIHPHQQHARLLVKHIICNSSCPTADEVCHVQGARSPDALPAGCRPPCAAGRRLELPGMAPGLRCLRCRAACTAGGRLYVTHHQHVTQGL